MAMAIFHVVGALGATFAFALLLLAIGVWEFRLTAIAFTFSCLLLTGRYPGEAKMARKSLADFIEQRNASAAKPVAPTWES